MAVNEKFSQPVEAIEIVSRSGSGTLLPPDVIDDGRARVEGGEPIEQVALDLVIQELALTDIGSDELRSASRQPESSLHKVADAHEPKLAVTFRYAFAMGRKALGKPANADHAVSAIKKALTTTLAPAIAKTLVAGGEAGAALLGARLRAAGDVEGHPFHGNQWTSREGRQDASEVFGNAVEVGPIHPPSADQYRDAIVESVPVSVLIPTQNTVSMSQVREIADKNVPLTSDRWQRDVSVHIEGDKHYILEGHHRLAAEKLKGSTHVMVRVTRSTLKGAELRTAKDVPGIKLTMRFDAANQAVIDWADRHAAELIDGITETSREQINNAVANQAETGEDSYDEILDAVGDEDRAQRIAHHEAMLAANEGQRQAWDQATEKGLLSADDQRVWILTDDEKVCPICEALGDTTTTLNGNYEADGDEYDGPPAHVGCRCTEGLA
jgi:hypothetical protein